MGFRPFVGDESDRGKLMARRPSGKAHILVPVAMALLLGGSTYTFMATNDVHASNVGTGVATIAGYSVGAIHYTPTGKKGDPSGLASVSFDLTPDGSNQPATDVAVWFNGNTTTVWSTNNGLCHQSGSYPAALTSWVCNIGGAKVYAGSSTQLGVAASG